MAPKSKNLVTKPSHGGSSSNPSRKVKQYEPRKFNLDDINQITNNLTNICGSGSYAKVYKGELDTEEVAVKVYEVEYKKAAEDEIQALTKLRTYPNIVPLKGTCFEETSTLRRTFLVMKFVPKNLETLLEGERLEWAETVSILKQLALGIGALAREELVVGDIKPDNILIDNKNCVYLCDFGSAKRVGESIPTFNWYYSPKDIMLGWDLGKGSLKTDIYSFGVILLQMIMKVNHFGKTNRRYTMEREVKMEVSKKIDKKGDKPHIAVYARCLMKNKPHVVDKTLIHSGCVDADAEKITQLGLQCTDDHEDNRPSISYISQILDELKTAKVRG